MPDNRDSILAGFPKSRPPLPQADAIATKEYYRKDRDADTTASYFSSKMKSWLHHKVSADNRDEHPTRSTLEIGAGTLNHLKYEKNHSQYDVIEPYENFYSGQEELQWIRNHYLDISEVPKGLMYDRVIFIATFEHITSLPQVVAEAVLHMKEDACMRIAIPSEGSPMWYLGWRFTTGFE